MSPRHPQAAPLARLLDSTDRPVYVMDEELTVVFYNRAMQEWLGRVAEGLVGQRCAYHSESNSAGPEAVAAGLCPPPQVLAGETVEATVCRIDERGKSVERSGRFFSLGGDNEDLVAIVAVLDAEDRSPESAEKTSGVAPTEVGTTELHERIRRFRNETAARYGADRLIGGGPAMRLARRQVELAAQCRCGVLLVGPSGSGRRRLAAAIHHGEKGKGAPATLDCSLLGNDAPEALASAAAGAYAGGLEEMPDTLLLHRVDEMPVDVQVQSAAVLSRQMAAWRLLSTAAEPLAELSRRGKFHADLAAMLSTITIELPPLAERREDIPLLAQMFLERRNAAGSRQIGGFSPAALDRLDAYHWPGNLDELAEAVAEAHGRATGREIAPQDLPERLRLAAQAAAQPRRIEESIVLDEFLGRVERELIRRALARAKGNKARAARLLGVTRPRLYRRMVQLGLDSG